MGPLYPGAQYCDSCQYLETSAGRDWYYCPQSSGGTIIGRFGDEPNEYGSTPLYIILDPARRWIADHRPGAPEGVRIDRRDGPYYRVGSRHIPGPWGADAR